MHHPKTGAATIALAAALLLPSLAIAQQKKAAAPKAPPPPVVTTCDAPPPAIRDISADRFYTDPRSSIADTMIVARNKSATSELDKPLRRIVTWSNRWQEKRDAGAAACALQWLSAWAGQGAMLGVMSATQAEYERKWRTAGMAIVYIKLKDQASPEQKAAIEPWLKALATKVEASDSLTKARNNHMYWIGLVSVAVGFGTDDPARQAAGKRMFDAGMAAIDTDGALPEELKRGALALHYHNYALAPLALSAEIASRFGQDWYAGASPIHRLAAFTANGLANRDLIRAKNGATQKVPSGGILGWQAFYGRRFPDKVKTLKPNDVYEYSWLGGDLTGLAKAWVR